jgi:FkbM family methyltransferase
MHTGTWFILNFLQQHSQFGKLIVEQDLYRECKADNGFTIYQHHHLPHRKWPYPSPAIGDNVPPLGPIIIPVRDPMKAALSMSTRLGNMPVNGMVDGFCFLANLKKNKSFNGWFKYMFVPIDTDMPHKERYFMLCDVLKHCGLPMEPYVSEYARQWKPQNKLPNHPHKKAYVQGRLSEAISGIPEYYRYLKKNENKIKPFLKQLGYMDLPWWEERVKMETYKKKFKNFTLNCRTDTWDEGIADEVINGDFYFLQKLKDDGGMPKAICDVGGHIGSFSRWANSLWPDAKIVTYEANPNNYSTIKKNTRPKNIKLFTKAMIGHDGPYVTFAGPELFGHGTNTGGGTIRTSKEREGTVDVEACTIKHALQELGGHIHLLKFDCEGAEGEILEYARDNDLLQYIDWIRGEWHGEEQLNRCYRALDGSHQMTHTVKSDGIGFFIAHRIA